MTKAETKSKRAKRPAIGSVEFVKVFAPMAKAGNTALEIGRALGIKGDDEKVAQYVSVKSSQLRAKMKEAAIEKARENSLSPEDTTKLLQATVDALPKLRGHGRKTGMSVINEVLETLNSL
jgi:hypothetical protein